MNLESIAFILEGSVSAFNQPIVDAINNQAMEELTQHLKLELQEQKSKFNAELEQ